VNLELLRNYVDEIEAAPLGALMDKASPAVRAALKRSRERQELTAEEGLLLYTAEGDDLRAAIKCADLARAEDVGNEVTYVVNRNINFTNICFVGCQFCGFKRQRWESDAYDHSDETIVGKVADAVARKSSPSAVYRRSPSSGVSSFFSRLRTSALRTGAAALPSRMSTGVASISST